MARSSKLLPSRVNWGDYHRWKVELTAKNNPSGKRRRYFFLTRQSAENFCEEQTIRKKNYGTAGMSGLSAAQLSEAAMAFEQLSPHRVALNEVIHDWINRRNAADASIPFEEAMDAFLDKDDRSESYVRSIRQTRNRLQTLHGALLNEITAEDLNRALDGMSASVRNFTIRILGGLFNFGIKRGYCVDNPCKKLDLARVEMGEVEIYTPAQVAKILSTADINLPGLLPFLALSFFCGIRRAEMLRLDWSAIDLHEDIVKLPAAITKTRRRRYIPISANAKAWLSPRLANEGRVVPYSSDILRKQLAQLSTAHKIPTIKHGARHCFASYWLAEHESINLLCQYLGHDDPETTFKHYAKVATKREATKFWAILPSATTPENIVTFSAREARR